MDFVSHESPHVPSILALTSHAVDTIAGRVVPEEAGRRQQPAAASGTLQESVQRYSGSCIRLEF